MRTPFLFVALFLAGDLVAAQSPHAFEGAANGARRMEFDEIFAKAHQMARPRPGESAARMAKRLSDGLVTDSWDRFNIAANAIQYWADESPRVALPALAGRLDDYRTVRVGVVALENGPGGFELVRQYGTARGEGVPGQVWNVILMSIPSYAEAAPYLDANPDGKSGFRAWVDAGMPGVPPPVPAKSLPRQRP